MIIELKVTSNDGTVLADFRTQVSGDEANQAYIAEVEAPREQRRMSLTEQIYWLVEANPGILAKAIPEVLKASNKDSVSATLSELKKRGLVENGAGEFNSWQWTVTDEAPPWENPSED
jgi:hypothetical protein